MILVNKQDYPINKSIIIIRQSFKKEATKYIYNRSTSAYSTIKI